MNIKNKAKKSLSKKTKRIAVKALKPFLPFIILFLGLLFAFCSIIDAIFVQDVQTDTKSLPLETKQIKEQCISKAEYLNTCHNYIGLQPTKNLLDMDDRERDKEIQWSHLYSIMAFHNMTNNTAINFLLLNQVAKEFESTFRYEEYTIKEEQIIKGNSATNSLVKDEKENSVNELTGKTQKVYLLVESDTIMGHYKYNYEERTVEENGVKTTKKVFIGEELIGEKYERLKKYLKTHLFVRDSDIETDVEIVIQAANGYYDGEESTEWLQGNSSSDTIITNGKGLVPTGMFTWPIPGYTTVTSKFGMRTHPITHVYKLHSGTDISAPIGANFVAMADGKVIKASYNSAYGNMVMIDHGDGIVTLYAHGSEILVTTNQQVTKGQAVLKVGSTGYSTGPHAHFEVRINGNFTNPMDYFEGGE